MDSKNSASDEELFPASFFCPLTLQVMDDPVVDSEGNSYERTAIESWLKRNSTSPVTRKPLSAKDLVPNRALKEAIEERRKVINNNDAKDNKKPSLKKQPQTNDEVKLPEEDKDTVVTISVDAKRLNETSDDALVMFSIQPPVGKQPTPSDIVCVVDVSGSMGTEAVMQNAQGKSETHGLSILDVVKHAVKTIIHILNSSDRLSLVVYSTTARVVFDLIPMTADNKKRAEKELENLSPEDSTNLWDGLYTGLEVLRNNKTTGRLSSVLLLTDGQPNVIPPRGHLPMLKRYKDQNTLPGSIHTFGFGYHLDSNLLKDLSIEGNGNYSFIPDSGFVGTVFVHSVSNILATFAGNLSLSIEPSQGVSVESNGVIGGHPTQYISWGSVVSLGTLQYEQVKHVVVKMKIPRNFQEEAKEFVTATLKFNTRNQNAMDVTSKSNTWNSNVGELEVQSLRLNAVDTLRSAIAAATAVKSPVPAVPLIESFLESLRSSTVASDPRVVGLIDDFAGQITEAFSRADWYNKWGAYYLPSLMGAHLQEICNNFKDPGIQFFGGKVFSDIRDRADDIFVKLPPPKSSRKTATPIVSMATYHSSGNTCFHGNCLVAMADGSTKKVSEVAMGDRVTTYHGKSSLVKCVVKTTVAKGNTELVQFPNGLLITPYHPIQWNFQWKFPIEIYEPMNVKCEAVYSFVLENDHVMLINGIQCVAMGHDIKGNKVVEHPYFGSKKVIDDLEKMIGWSCGLVTLQDYNCLIRNVNDNLICGLVQ